MTRITLYFALLIVILMLVTGCQSADRAVPPPTTESLAAERRRIEADPNMPPAAKQSALMNLSRREQEIKK